MKRPRENMPGGDEVLGIGDIKGEKMDIIDNVEMEI